MKIGSFVPVVALLAIVGMSLPQASAQTTYRYADPTGFDTLSSPGTKTFNFRSAGDLAITSSGFSVAAASGISTSATSFTYPAASPYDNPPWIAGYRPLFKIAFDDGGGTTLGSTINLEISFSQPLPAGTQLVFGDFDWRERLWIKAYADDAKTQLIPFANSSFAKQNGGDPLGSTANVQWVLDDPATSGLLTSEAYLNFNDPVATLVASTLLAGSWYVRRRNRKG